MKTCEESREEKSRETVRMRTDMYQPVFRPSFVVANGYSEKVDTGELKVIEELHVLDHVIVVKRLPRPAPIKKASESSIPRPQPC